MKEIVIKVPDNFSDKQVEFIKKSAMLQIEAEIRKEAVLPQNVIDAVEAKVAAAKVAMGIAGDSPIGGKKMLP